MEKGIKTIEVLVPCTITLDLDHMAKYKYNPKKIMKDILKELSEGVSISCYSSSGYSFEFKPTTIKRLKQLSGL